MSLPITLLLLLVVFYSVRFASRRVLTSFASFRFSLLAGFCLAVAADLSVDLSSPNDGVGLLAGLLTAILAPALLVVVCRAWKVSSRAVRVRVRTYFYVRRELRREI